MAVFSRVFSICEERWIVPFVMIAQELTDSMIIWNVVVVIENLYLRFKPYDRIVPVMPGKPEIII
jgi:hypothetical protein